MTNRLPPGTSNLSINLPDEAFHALGRAACERDESRNRFLKRLIVLGIEREDPALARKLREAMGKALLILLGIGSLAAGMSAKDQFRIRGGSSRTVMVRAFRAPRRLEAAA